MLTKSQTLVSLNPPNPEAKSAKVPPLHARLVRCGLGAQTYGSEPVPNISNIGAQQLPTLFIIRSLGFHYDKCTVRYLKTLFLFTYSGPYFRSLGAIGIVVHVVGVLVISCTPRVQAKLPRLRRL